MPAFHAMLPVRDEGDIIAESLSAMLKWADHIYIYDTGSVDETWEIVCDFASQDARVRPLRNETVYFNDTIVRGWIFNQARERMKTGDWFLRVDADEFHHISPQEFVHERMEKHETLAYHQYYNFVLRESEVANWEAGRENMDDRARSISERRQWYQPSIYAEPRLCRYREGMKWPSFASFPFNAGLVAKQRLPIRHYPHRDPRQLDRRSRLRALMMADPENRANWSEADTHHWTQREWRKSVVPDDALGLLHWQPGHVLAELQQSNHLAKPLVRVVQRLVHGYLLPILDPRRAGWDGTVHPKEIGEHVQARLAQELASSGESRFHHPTSKST